MQSNGFKGSVRAIRPRKGEGKVPLRAFVVAAVSFGVGDFGWNRTGDYLISIMLFVLTAAVIDIRVGDSNRNDR